VNAEIRTLTRTAGLPASFSDALIDRGATVEEARAALFDAITSRSTHIPAFQIGQSGDDPSVIRTRAADALAHRLGAPGNLPEASRQFRDQGLHQTLRIMLAARGEPGVLTMPVADLLQRSMTTSDLPVLLTETTNRLLQPAYQAALSPIRQRLTRVTSSADFREQFEGMKGGSGVRTVISPEEGAELKRLYADYAISVNRAAVILASRGMDSPEFADADKASGVLWRRIREILGE
jgi:hypothetical protein